MIKRLWYEESGLTTLEYALILALVAVAALAVWAILGKKVESSANRSSSALPSR